DQAEAVGHGGDPQVQVVEWLAVAELHASPALGPRSEQGLAQAVGVNGPVGVDQQADPVLVQRDHLLAVALGSLHRHEGAELVVPAHQALTCTLEGHRARQPAQPQRNDEPSVLGELLDPCGWDVPCARGDDDPVERGVFWNTVGGVAQRHVDPPVSGGVEVASGSAGDLRIDVDGDHSPGPTDQFGDQCRVVAAGTYLQYSHSPVYPCSP